MPALAGYIAYAIADRPGIAPGFVAGAVAVFMGAGFLGGIVGGLIAGYVAPVDRQAQGGPLAARPDAGGHHPAGRVDRGFGPDVRVPGPPTSPRSLTGSTSWLSGLTGASAIVLGVILGLMMCFDLGGPVNKVAYSFAVAGLGAASITNQAP